MITRRFEWTLAAVVAAAVLGSGVWVVQVKHESRQRFVELEELKREKDRLQIDWGRLRIEQSTWATHPRIESVAREELELAEPSDSQVVVLARPEQ